MPRLLPALIRCIKDARKDGAPATHTPQPQRTRQSIPTALPYPSFSPHGRKQSILLDEVNPIMHHDAYIQHKLDAPVIPSVAGRGKHTKSSRQTREMTVRECEWWSNPYLRMLASPLRQCMVTEKQLPADFLVRLAPLQVSGPRISRTTTALLPDGLEHSRFRRRNSGRGYYVICHKVSIEQLVSRGSYKRIPSESNLRVHSLLATQISHQLRLKVLQELELLAESLRCTPQGSLEFMALRRLTRTEWAEIKTTGRIHQPGAVAVLVVPPLNKHRVREGQDPSDWESKSGVKPVLPPLSVLHETEAAGPPSVASQSYSTPQVPLYNGLALFPDRSLRSKFHRALQTMLLVERRARWRQEPPSGRADSMPRESDTTVRDKASHAYLLRSDENTLHRADSVPLAIALWRVRMWEGQGWEGDVGTYGSWATVN